MEERGSSSTTIENKSSHKRKRDSFDCSEGSDQADKATKKSSKVKENMEKFSACKGVIVSEVKKRKHRHAHKIKSASGTCVHVTYFCNSSAMVHFLSFALICVLLGCCPVSPEFHCVALPFQLEVLALTTDHSLDEPLELAVSARYTKTYFDSFLFPDSFSPSFIIAAGLAASLLRPSALQTLSKRLQAVRLVCDQSRGWQPFGHSRSG